MSFAPKCRQNWYLRIVITHVQKNRTRVNFSLKLSLIHAWKAPRNILCSDRLFFFIWPFQVWILSFAPPILAKGIFRNSHYLYTKKSHTNKFLLKVIAYTYQWCSKKVFWVLTACFFEFDFFRVEFVPCTANFGKIHN